MTKVYPTKASALNAHHPIAGKPLVEGSEWPYDTFTCRRLTDGSFTEDPAKAYKPPASEVAEKKPAPVAEAKSQDAPGFDAKAK
jgi:hypothetical protein